MKFLQRIIIIFTLALLYCLSVYTISNHKPIQGIVQTSFSEENSFCFKAFDFLENALQSEEVNLIVNLVPQQVIKDKTQELIKTALFNNTFLVNTESHYFYFSKSLLCSLTHYDIVFPFHYFL